MALDNTETQEVDLERTDRLPILDPALIDDDVVDDAIRLDMATVVPRIKSEFERASGADSPSLANSVRSVEKRVARQKADYDALGRAHDEVRKAEVAAVARGNALGAELATLRGVLATEQARTRQVDKALADKTALADTMRSRLEDALREVERHQREARTLRDTLVARDATIVQVLHSLGERDAQLSALQREHARLVPDLEERSRVGVHLETDLRSAVAHAESTAADLRDAQASVATLTERIKTQELELAGARSEMSNARLVRDDLDQNVVRDLDAKLAAAQSDRVALKAACDQLRRQVSELESKLAVRDEVIAKLQAASVDDRELRARQETEVFQVESKRTELMHKIAAMESEQTRLTRELTVKDQALDEALTAGRADLQRSQEKLVIAEQTHVALRGEVARLQADRHTREEEMGVLHAHLQAARRPPESVDPGTQWVMHEPAAKATALDQVKQENRNLSAELERARDALKEREFLIRRLGRSESNDANAPGRMQTTIERTGTSTGLPANAVTPAECTAELVRTDGEHRSTHVLGRRSRIGRAPGCEILIRSSSVSRHHALILVGMREVIIEDLNSTNGVLVNERKVARQLLSDGDRLTIGEAQFILNLKVDQRA